jgi:hypothetical protein
MKNSQKLNLDAATLLAYKAKIEAEGRNFLYGDEEENNDEYAHFFFIGRHDGKEVIYDAALYTLRLKYESELFELAEEKVIEQYPQYNKIANDKDQNVGNAEQEEEIGLYMAEVMLAIEAEEDVKVQEHVDIELDEDFEHGIGLEASINEQQITSALIERFVNNFNNNTVKLDPVNEAAIKNKERFFNPILS